MRALLKGYVMTKTYLAPSFATLLQDFFVERLMQERRTAVGPGRFFDAPAHFRLGYGGDADKIRGGLDRLTAALDGLQEERRSGG